MKENNIASNKIFESSLSQLFRVIEYGISRIGLSKVIERLRSSIDFDADNQHSLHNIIIECSCKTFGENWEYIKSKKRLGGRQLYLAQTIALLLQKYALFTQIEIAKVMNKNKSSVSKYVHKMNFSNPKSMTRDEKEYYDKFQKIEIRIKEIQSN
ncbi:MAG: hypothetical protein EBQ89_04470 [Alphaproteobacteria bacterium]|nr:hypothetical protein [Alphaproteobacteria bacterium]